MTRLSFVIPCYRSEQTIEKVVEEIINTVEEHQQYTYEIILVSDYSPDNVFGVITKMCESNENITGVELSQNFGQHAALMAGYRVATGDLIISLDDDGQTPAKDVFKLVDKLNKGYDVVYASYNEKRHSVFRRIGSFINDMMAQQLIKKPKHLKITSYFVAKKFIIDEIIKYKNSYPYIIGLILRVTNNIANVPVIHRERVQGVSGYNLTRLFSLWLNGFTAFSIKPLRVATFLGVVCACLGFLFGSYTVLNKIINPATPAGYSSLMSALLFIGGMLMLILGLIGEYIGRIYISLNNSPQYVIRKKVGNYEKHCDN